MGIGTLIFVGIGILTLAIVFMLAPQIGGQMDAAMPALGATSDTPAVSGRTRVSSPGRNWNASHNTNLKTGADIWGTLSPFVMIPQIVKLLSGRESGAGGNCRVHYHGSHDDEGRITQALRQRTHTGIVGHTTLPVFPGGYNATRA